MYGSWVVASKVLIGYRLRLLALACRNQVQLRNGGRQKLPEPPERRGRLALFFVQLGATEG